MKPNWKNQTVFIGDNIDIMRAMNTESVDQICADPPFNKQKRFDYVFEKGKQFSAGHTAQAAVFEDIWRWNEPHAWLTDKQEVEE